MKKWTHLYVFIVLSLLSSLLRLYTVFFTSFDEATVRAQYEGFGLSKSLVDSTVTMMRESTLFSTNLVNRLLAVILFILLIASLVFIVKKQGEKASYIYIGYLFGTLAFSTYSYVATQGIIARAYTEEQALQGATGGALGSYGVTIALFALYFGLTVFFLLRKPKEKVVTQTATDI